MKRTILGLFVALSLMGCEGEPGPTGPSGQDGKDAVITVRTWERADLNAATYLVNIPWGDSEEVFIVGEVYLNNGGGGWAPISTLWTPNGTDLYQSFLVVQPTNKMITLYNAYGRFRVHMYVLAR